MVFGKTYLSPMGRMLGDVCAFRALRAGGSAMRFRFADDSLVAEFVSQSKHQACQAPKMPLFARALRRSIVRGLSFFRCAHTSQTGDSTCAHAGGKSVLQKKDASAPRHTYC